MDPHDNGTPHDLRPNNPGTTALARRFREAWTGSDDPHTADADLFPLRLATATAACLDVDGAGLSMYERGFRVPLGASSEAATLAERLQFTQGEGPCLEAARLQHAIVADPETLDSTWASFTEELRRHTPYRAIISIPLTTDTFTGALDLYLIDASRIGSISLVDAVVVSREILSAVRIIQTLTDPTADPSSVEELGPTWLRTPVARRRSDVWIASGILMARYHLGAVDSVALLRAHAYAHDSTLDDTAAALLAGTLDSADLAP